MLYKSLNIPNRTRIYPNTPTRAICEMIQDYIYGVCFSLPKIDKAKLILAFKGALNVIDKVET